jgi:uncharacterized protein
MRAEPGAHPAHARLVVDTNVLISAALSPNGVPASLLDRVLAVGALAFSSQTFAELESRLWKPKFDRFLSIELRNRLLGEFSASACWVEISADIGRRRFSRDPDDDALVHAALAADARRLVSGDQDLLRLHAVDSLRIVSPRAALSELVGMTSAPADR